MASQDDILQTRAPKAYKDDRGGAVLVPHATIGIVKNNIDPLRSGKIKVFLKHLYSEDENNPKNWTPVRYMSPFFGYTANTGSPDSDGTFMGNRTSYGFWATPPDVGTEVICIFINGQLDYGYYIGSIPPPTLNHMVPAIGAFNYIIPNEGESEGYGGAVKLPAAEYNDANDGQNNSDTPQNNPRPVHSTQAAILNKQGLIRDTIRGVISSSAQRESPSNVFGISTPGRPIYAGGFNNQNNASIVDAVKDSNIPDNQFLVTGRMGGHTIVMDDGDIGGNDQLMRFRSSSGHMIMMNDTAQTLFIIHSNGQSWIELGKEGTIDMYSTNSVNVRTQGDLNLHADRNININAAETLNVSAKNINMESLEATNQFVGTTYKGFVKSAYTLKVNDKMSLYSKGDSSIKSDGTNYLNGGPNVHLNTGASSLVPQEVKQLPVVVHTDTLYDSEKGYIPAPAKLSSIVNRAPAHQPWVNGNQGVDVKTNLSASSNLPVAPSKAIQSINEQVAKTSTPTTNQTLSSTVPNLNPVGNPLDKITTSSLVSQMAVNAGTGSTANIIPKTAGIVDINNQKVAVLGNLGLNPNQLESAGFFKPGSSTAINAAINNGKTLEQAIPPNVFTGKDGVGSFNSLINNKNAQAGAAADLLGQSEIALKAEGLITGKESSGAIGGLVLAGASVGVPSVASFVKEGKNIIPPNTPPNDIKSLVAGGNNAGGQADQTKTAITSVADKVKGLAASAFDTIKSTYKKLTANKPQNLEVANQNNTEASKKAAEQAKQLVQSYNVNELTSVGESLRNNVSSIQGSLNQNSTNIASAGTNVLSTNSALLGGTLSSFAKTNLPPEAASKLETAISAAGTPGSIDVKAVTVAENTNSVVDLNAQTQVLLGSNKIPPVVPLAIPVSPMSDKDVGASIYAETPDKDLIYKGKDPKVWVRVNSERERRGLPGLAEIGYPRPSDDTNKPTRGAFG